MDYLIEKLQTFGITKNEKQFNDSINELLNYLSVHEFDSDQEWNNLKRNYSNLKYIKQLLNFYDYRFNTNFHELLTRFLEYIDKNTQVYIKNIDWDVDDELRDCCLKIRENFEKSLNDNSIDNKIKYILNAYDILIPIVEDYHREKCQEVVDYEFREQFSPKRLKM